jgi:hypothetical protein
LRKQKTLKRQIENLSSTCLCMVPAPQGACRLGTADDEPRGRREGPGGGEARAPVVVAEVRGQNWVTGLWFLKLWSAKSRA